MCMIEASDCRELVQYRLPKPDNTWAGLTFPDGHVKLGESVMFATIHKVSKRRLASRSPSGYLSPRFLRSWVLICGNQMR